MTTIADQIDLPHRLEDRHIEICRGGGEGAPPGGDRHLAGGGTRGPSQGLAGGEPGTAGGAWRTRAPGSSGKLGFVA